MSEQMLLVLLGASVVVIILVIIIIKFTGKEAQIYYEDSGEVAPRPDVTSAPLDGAAIWSGDLSGAEIQDKSHLADIYLKNIPGIDKIDTKISMNKFEFK